MCLSWYTSVEAQTQNSRNWIERFRHGRRQESRESMSLTNSNILSAGKRDNRFASESPRKRRNQWRQPHRSSGRTRREYIHRDDQNNPCGTCGDTTGIRKQHLNNKYACSQCTCAVPSALSYHHGGPFQGSGAAYRERHIRSCRRHRSGMALNIHLIAVRAAPQLRLRGRAPSQPVCASRPVSYTHLTLPTIRSV